MSSLHRSGVLAVLLGACVATPVTQDATPDLAGAAQPIVVPIAGAAVPASPDERIAAEFYRGLLIRLNEAYTDGDLPLLRRLLATGRSDQAPAWARERRDNFAAAADGLALEQHCRQWARLDLVETGTLGTRLRLELVLPPVPGVDYVLGGEADPMPFALGMRLQVDDEFTDGSTGSQGSGATLRLPRAVALGGGKELRVPIELDPPATAAVRRTVRVRVELLPGYVQVAGRRAPLRRTELGVQQVTQYPAGHEPLRTQPLLALREAMRRGDPDHFPHVWLAAVFAPETERAAVLAELVQWVRLGRPDQQQVAMAALKAVTGARPAVGDRESWRAWWQARQ